MTRTTSRTSRARATKATIPASGTHGKARHRACAVDVVPRSAGTANAAPATIASSGSRASPVAEAAYANNHARPAVVRRPTTVLGRLRRLGRGAGPGLTVRDGAEHRGAGCDLGPDTDVGAGQQCGSGADSGSVPHPDHSQVQDASVDPVPAQVDLRLDGGTGAEPEHAGDRWEGVQIDAGPEAASEQSRMEGDEGGGGQVRRPELVDETLGQPHRRWTLPPRGYSPGRMPAITTRAPLAGQQDPAEREG